MSKYEYRKLNDTPIQIEHVEDEHQEERDFEASFWFENRRWFPGDFRDCHTSPYAEYPEYIHMWDGENFRDPIFIEYVDEEQTAVNVYREVEIIED